MKDRLLKSLTMIFIVCLCMGVFIACDTTANKDADNEQTQTNNEEVNFTFTLINNDTEYELSDCAGNATRIIIPSIYNGKPVTRIGDNAFYDYNSLTSITIPSSIISVGRKAFYMCDALMEVRYTGTIDQWVMIDFIGEYKYSNPVRISRPLYINNEIVKEVKLTTATTITENSLKGLSLNLIRIEIGESVESIEKGAFSNNLIVEVCNNSNIDLTKINLDGTNYYGLDRLLNCYSSENGSSKLSKQGDFIIYTNADEKIIVRYTGNATNLEIPYGVTRINGSACASCQSLKSVKISKTVTSIGETAFGNCKSLLSVFIPNSVKIIEGRMFGLYENAVVYCETETKPDGWHEKWNYSGQVNDRVIYHEVVWGYNK